MPRATLHVRPLHQQRASATRDGLYTGEHGREAYIPGHIPGWIQERAYQGGYISHPGPREGSLPSRIPSFLPKRLELLANSETGIGRLSGASSDGNAVKRGSREPPNPDYQQREALGNLLTRVIHTERLSGAS